METIFARCVGLDVQKDSILACVRLLEAGWYEPTRPGVRHLSTLVQQVLSVVAGRGGASPAETHRALCASPGAAFSVGTGYTIVFTLIAAAVVVAILRVSRRLYSRRWAIALGALLGGALGNLLDRMFRDPGPLRGHVVDWIELPHWPVFNLADSAIVGAAVLMVLLAVTGREVDGTVHR